MSHNLAPTRLTPIRFTLGSARLDIAAEPELSVVMTDGVEIPAASAPEEVPTGSQAVAEATPAEGLPDPAPARPPEIVNCRPTIAWRRPGEERWRMAVARYWENASMSDFQVSFRGLTEHMDLDVALRPYGRTGAWEIRATLISKSDEPLELARVHYLDGVVREAAGLLELRPSGFPAPRLRHPEDRIAPTRDTWHRQWSGSGGAYRLLADPVHDAPDWAISTDAAAVLRTWDGGTGWGIGFTGPGTAFGEIGLTTGAFPQRLYMGVRLDNVVLEPGTTRELEGALLWCGDWQAGLRLWAQACAEELAPPQPAPPPVGHRVSLLPRGLVAATAADAETVARPDAIGEALRQFESWPIPPGGRMLLVGDGYEKCPGDWSPNKAFAERWAALPEFMERHGFAPGIRIAPTAVHESHQLARECPELLQRGEKGEPCLYTTRWGGRTYFLDPDHPGAQQVITENIEALTRGGWRLIQVDYTHTLATGRMAVDRTRTAMETLRGLHALLRQAAGPDVRLLAGLGTPDRCAIGYVDIATIAGASGIPVHGTTMLAAAMAGWRNIKATLFAALACGAVNGVWWVSDPGPFHLLQGVLPSTEEERHLLTATLGLCGGVFATADLPGGWTARNAAVAQAFWAAPRVPFDHRMVLSAEGELVACRFSFADGRRPTHRVALYNMRDEAAPVSVALADLGLDGAAQWRLSLSAPLPTGAGVPRFLMHNGLLELAALPAHAMRIADLEAE
ncbi:hypothetical protein DB346_20300 [Verrucomicrobia bacterium LW23]|nr:hypothetical protein DB346_20300 [Verrucomicrobia bacterium LW23]